MLCVSNKNIIFFFQSSIFTEILVFNGLCDYCTVHLLTVKTAI